jgi:thioesterase domain-containing protein
VDGEVRRLQRDFPFYQTVTIGHSLGGAIATYAAAELRSRGIRTDLVCLSIFQELKRKNGSRYTNGETK